MTKAILTIAALNLIVGNKKTAGVLFTIALLRGVLS